MAISATALEVCCGHVLWLLTNLPLNALATVGLDTVAQWASHKQKLYSSNLRIVADASICGAVQYSTAQCQKER